MTKLSLQKLQVNLATHYYEKTIEGIYLSATQAKVHLEKELKQQANDITVDNSLSKEEKAYLIDTLSDECFLSEKTTELAGEMMVVAFYKTIEIAIKDMLKFSGLFTEAQIRSFYRIAELKKQVSKKICNIEKLNGFNVYDELRCINNCIKHSGKVNDELSKYPNWKKGSKLSNLDKKYWRLKAGVNGFVKSLQKEILAKMV
ncbi:MAG: hypothetical protein KGL01_06510 [Betaproteobacteria bacterium]|nr:hypothetical protein [Betaproteobacteria bacterium]